MPADRKRAGRSPDAFAGGSKSALQAAIKTSWQQAGCHEHWHRGHCRQSKSCSLQRSHPAEPINVNPPARALLHMRIVRTHAPGSSVRNDLVMVTLHAGTTTSVLGPSKLRHGLNAEVEKTSWLRLSTLTVCACLKLGGPVFRTFTTLSMSASSSPRIHLTVE